MRLDQIKLAGFKSFADPTVFQLPGRRVGVVGPNGCGKSNIIDAVRWVLGESKASELRGESMQDVIFNGSSARKAAGRASVELVFDNQAARAGGAWNRYAQIAVKRVLTRDGASSYHINNQPVRRRDVQDVFLGTGLGPRAYAIIGQGTISRIIESRPEELRLFLEEAAGVSKYKERRRETENRLEDTRENLARVGDILRELDANVEKLDRQAAVATNFRRLEAAAAAAQHRLWFVRRRDAAVEEARIAAAVGEAALALEARLADLRRTEAELERLRPEHLAAGDLLHAGQGALAAAALEVSRIEERIRYVVEAHRRAGQRLDELDRAAAAWLGRLDAAASETSALVDRIAASDAGAVTAEALATHHAAGWPALAETLRAARDEAATQRTQVVDVQQQIRVLAAEGGGIDEQLRSAASQRERLDADRSGLQAPDAFRLGETLARRQAAEAGREAADAALRRLADAAPALEEQRRSLQRAANEAAARSAGLDARLDALRGLQLKLKSQGRLEPWLRKHGLADLPALWTHLHVEPGWESALEAVLRERLGAFQVSRLETVRAFAADAPPARLAFFSPALVQASADGRRNDVGLPLLAERSRLSMSAAGASLDAVFGDWLAGVHAAEHLDEALAHREALPPGGTIVTRDGHAVSRFAVAFHAPDTEQSGMLARAQEIENLEREARAQAIFSGEAHDRLVRAETAHAQAAQALAAARREAADAQSRAHALQVESLRLQQQHEAAATRRGQLDARLDELAVQLESLRRRRTEGEARFEALDLRLAAEQERFTALEDASIEAERRLAAANEERHRLERDAQAAQFERRALGVRRDELARAAAAAEEQIAANAAARADAERELAALDRAADDQVLQQALAVRVERESVLAAARVGYETMSAELRRTDESRLSLERGLEPLRERIVEHKLAEQAARLAGAQIDEQLDAAGADRAALAGWASNEDAGEAHLRTRIDALQREIAVLGAVNLAALDELAGARERKAFIDAQNADLNDAIQTLEAAIRKIDAETRELLGATFEQVNAHFGRMFPTLFGGGSAMLAMTGDEILDAGVQVMAQPPGKRNSTIHLLSGGEKALTAIALVFAIFQLNPAPFCLLDEVDAPLDDANTERYARLVTEMSAGTQFLFISHNRIAMEMAEQLVGVTMQEQGVSRVVAVDLETAAGMATAAP